MAKYIIDEIKKALLRQELKKHINNLEKTQLITISNLDEFDALLFNTNKTTNEKTFALEKKFLTKIDFENVSFKDVNVKGFDFRGLNNVHINPQEVFNKDMRNTKLSGVDITGPFDDVYISGADFENSEKALIDPQKVRDKDLSNVNISSVAFIYDMNGVKVNNMQYGSCLMVSREESPSVIAQYEACAYRK